MTLARVLNVSSKPGAGKLGPWSGPWQFAEGGSGCTLCRACRGDNICFVCVLGKVYSGRTSERDAKI